MVELTEHKSAKAMRILTVTRELLLKRGFRGITVAQIAERAHVGKGTVYLYWDTKEDLFAELVTRDFLAAVDDYIAVLEGDPEQIRPHRLLPRLIRIGLEYPFVRAIQAGDVDTLGLLAEHPSSRQWLAELGPDALLTAVLPVWRTHGLVRQDWDLDAQTYMVRALIDGFFGLAANTKVVPAVAVEKPDEVLAATVREVLEVADPPTAGIAAAARETLRLLVNSRGIAAASLSSARDQR
jgi:AcrR family transcriptional regulator